MIILALSDADFPEKRRIVRAEDTGLVCARSPGDDAFLLCVREVVDG